MWYNTVITVQFLPIEPYVMFIDNELSGLEIKIISLFADRMKFKINFRQSRERNWGLSLPNGTYSGTFGDMQANKCELVVGVFSPNVTCAKDFDMSFPYLDDNLVWVVPKARLLAAWAKLVGIFDFKSWMLIFLMLIVIYFTFYAFTYHTSDQRSHWHSFENSYSVLLASAVSKMPYHLRVRIVFMSWSIFCLILKADFDASFISTLLADSYEKQVETQADMISAKLKLGCFFKVRDKYKYSNDSKEIYIHQHAEECMLNNVCLDKVAFNRDYGTVKPRREMNYLISLQYMTPQGDTLLYVIKDAVARIMVSIYTRKGYPMFPQLDKFLRNAKSSGFIRYWETMLSYTFKLKHNSYIRKSTLAKSHGLGLNQLFSSFVFLLIVEISTYFPFKTLNVHEPEINPQVIGECRNGVLGNATTLYVNKFPLTWSRSVVTVEFLPLEPYIMFIDSQLTGVEIELAKLIAEKMNFKIEFKASPIFSWGYKLANGTYTDMLGKLQRSECDFVLGSFRTDSTFAMDFEMSFNFMDDYMVWVVPRATLLEPWAKLIRIFDFPSWMMIFVMLIVMTFSFHLISYRTTDHRGYWHSFEASYAILIATPLPKLPHYFRVRLIFLCWCIFCLILKADFDASFISTLLTDSYEKQIRTQTEMVDAHLRLGFLGALVLIFDDSNNRNDRYISEHFESCPIGPQCLEEVIYSRDFATIKPKKVVQHYENSHYSSPQESPIYVVQDEIAKYIATIYFKKGHPMFLLFDKYLMDVVTSGFIGHWDSMLKHMVKLKHNSELAKSFTTTSRALSVTQLSSSFVFLAFVIVSVEEIRLNLPYPVAILNLKEQVYFYIKKVDIYVIEGDYDDLVDKMLYLSSLQMWNPSAKFVILTRSYKINEIYQLYANMLVYDVLVIHLEDTTVMKISSYFPFESLNVRAAKVNPKAIGECRSGILRNTSELYTNNLPLVWLNSVITADCLILEPYIMCIDNNLTGVKVELAKLIADKIQFKIDFRTKQKTSWGFKLTNGTYTDMLGHMQSGDCDFVLEVFRYNATLAKDFEMSFNFMNDYLVCIVPRANLLEPWTKLIRIFDHRS
ncbi:hypothetical protein Trydic_g3147 [Trypoxylus dichotomus]